MKCKRDLRECIDDIRMVGLDLDGTLTDGQYTVFDNGFLYTNPDDGREAVFPVCQVVRNVMPGLLVGSGGAFLRKKDSMSVRESLTWAVKMWKVKCISGHFLPFLEIHGTI